VSRLSTKHTLVIPTFNRPGLLKRLVLYYCDLDDLPNMLILDSSCAEDFEANQLSLSGLSGNVRHMQFSQDTEFATKLSAGLKTVTTPYVSFCADDDLVFLSAVRKSMDILEAESSAVSVHGLYMNFREEGQKVHITCEYGNPSNDAAQAGARVFRLFQKYESLFYSVFRTQDLKEIFAEVEKLPTLHFQELFQSVAALLKGKVLNIEQIYAARRSGPEADPTRDKWQTYYWFMDNPSELMAHYQSYRNALLDLHERAGFASGVSRSDMQVILDAAHAVYFSANCPPPYFWSILQRHWPDEPFIKAGERDLFETIKNRSRTNSVLTRLDEPKEESSILKWLKERFAGPGERELNAEARKRFDQPWKCVLPLELRWIAENKDFRDRYFDLCEYLNKA
jgi:glycosyltransferase domain-containing protein